MREFMEKKATLGKLALLATAIIWGSSFVVLKSSLDSMGTLWVLSVRFIVAALLLGLAAGKRLWHVSKRCLKGSVMMGLCLAVAYIVQTYGLMYTTPGKNAFLTAAYCVLTPFLAWAIYKRRPGKMALVAAFLCISGVGLVALNEGLGQVNIGDVLTLCCGVFYALQIIMLENYRDSGNAITISAIQFAAGAVICLAGALIFEPVPTAISSRAFWELAYLSVMCTAVCFFLQAWGARTVSSSVTAIIMSLESVFGVLTSVIFYGEKVIGKMLLGFALIFMAVIVSEVKLPSFSLKKPNKA